MASPAAHAKAWTVRTFKDLHSTLPFLRSDLPRRVLETGTSESDDRATFQPAQKENAVANRDPSWIRESFESFEPGPITKDEMPGTWLSISTDTPGEHRISADYPDVKPLPSYGDGKYVLLSGPGSVSFRLKNLVASLYLGIWSLSGNGGTVHARYFGASGKTLAEIDHNVVQTGSYGYYSYSGDVIAGVEISRNGASPDHVCIDNFATFDEEQMKKLKALKKTNLTIEDLSR